MWLVFSLAVGKRSEGPWAPLGHLWCWVNNNSKWKQCSIYYNDGCCPQLRYSIIIPITMQSFLLVLILILELYVMFAKQQINSVW